MLNITVHQEMSNSEKWSQLLDELMQQNISKPHHQFPKRIEPTDSTYLLPKQISIENKKVHIISKVSDNLDTGSTFSHDQKSKEPKVFCWNDISYLADEVAFKTVCTELEKEYKYEFPNSTIEFSKLSTLTASQEDEILICHIYAPLLNNDYSLNISTHKSSSYSSKNIWENYEIRNQKSNDTIFTPNEFLDFCSIQTSPSIFIFDCPNSSQYCDILRTTYNDQIFVLALSNEFTPYTPHLPYDIFTSCLFSPSKISLLIQTQNYDGINFGILKPLTLNSLILLDDNSSILASLDEVLDQFIDCIAFETLSKNDLTLFYRLFRSDKVTTKLFYHFIFACRVLRFLSTGPISYPTLPDMSLHPLWDVFDLQVDRVLYSINNPNIKSIFSFDKILEEQLQQLENWIILYNINRETPIELSWIAPLLANPKFFVRSIKFVKKFITISNETTHKFLDTKGFPILVNKMNEIEQYDTKTLSNYSFVIAASILLSSELKSFFLTKTTFWKNIILNADAESLILSSLCCLIQFDVFEDISPKIFELTKHSSSKVRTLSNLYLSKMRNNIETFKTEININKEEDPLCRSTLISRIAQLIRNLEPTDKLRNILYFELIMNLDNPFSFVREEALIELSSIFDNDLLEYCKKFDISLSIQNPLITYFSHKLSIFPFELSPIVTNRIIEFLNYIEDKINDKHPIELKSNLTKSCLSCIIHSNDKFNDEQIEINSKGTLLCLTNNKFINKPAISPSGLLLCSDDKAIISCQTPFNNEQMYNFFNPKVNYAIIPQRFHLFFGQRESNPSKILYNTYINDYRILAVSNSSQVIVIDSHSSIEPICSFWMSEPDICKFITADYNINNYHILASSEFWKGYIFDVETQKRNNEVMFDKGKVLRMQWLGPFNSLFYVIQEQPNCMINIYDERTNEKEISFKWGNDVIVGCNASLSMPMDLVVADENGKLAIIDLRAMGEVERSSLGRTVKQFEVHRQLPIGMGVVDNSVFALMFNDGLRPDYLGNINIDSFCLHNSDASCAIRIGNKVENIDIRIDV